MTVGSKFSLSLFYSGMLICSSQLLADSKQIANAELVVQTFAVNPPRSTHILRDIDVKTCGHSSASQSLKIAGGRLENLVVWLEPLNARTPLSSSNAAESQSNARITVKGCEFGPRVSIITTDGSLAIHSEDPVLFQIRSTGKKNQRQSKSLPPNLRAVQMKFREPEIVTLSCDLHSWMKAYVFVAPHTAYRVSNSNGEARFEKVPRGTYSLFYWHELTGKQKWPEIIDLNTKHLTKKIEVDFKSNS